MLQSGKSRLSKDNAFMIRLSPLRRQGGAGGQRISGGLQARWRCRLYANPTFDRPKISHLEGSMLYHLGPFR